MHMFRNTIIITSALVFLSFTAQASESDKPENGSQNILIEGQQAKRAGDMPDKDVIYSPNVFFNGKPAIIGCKKGTPITSSSLIVNGQPAILGCKQ